MLNKKSGIIKRLYGYSEFDDTSAEWENGERGYARVFAELDSEAYEITLQTYSRTVRELEHLKWKRDREHVITSFSNTLVLTDASKVSNDAIVTALADISIRDYFRGFPVVDLSADCKARKSSRYLVKLRDEVYSVRYFGDASAGRFFDPDVDRERGEEVLTALSEKGLAPTGDINYGYSVARLYLFCEYADSKE